MRQYPDLTGFGYFGKAIKAVLTAAKNVCRSDYTHLVFYSYCELSVKEGERARRVEKAIGIIGVMAIAEEIPIQQQIQKFWASSKKQRKHTTVGQIGRSPGSQ